VFYGEPDLPHLPDENTTTRVLVVEPDPLLALYGQTTTIGQSWVDLFRLPGWQAAEFTAALLPLVSSPEQDAAELVTEVRRTQSGMLPDDGIDAAHARYVHRLPFHTPDSLEALPGPDTGVVRVPPHVCTAPDPLFDVSDPGQCWHLYSAVVRDGTAADQVAYLNRARLVELWPDLNLPSECRQKWATSFPELRSLPVRALVV